MAPDYEHIILIIIKIDNTRLPPLLAAKKYHNIKNNELESTLEDLVCEIKQSQDSNLKHKKFNKYLDEKFGDIYIADHRYTTSFALERIDHLVYKDDMINWYDNLIEEKN